MKRHLMLIVAATGSGTLFAPFGATSLHNMQRAVFFLPTFKTLNEYDVDVGFGSQSACDRHDLLAGREHRPSRLPLHCGTGLQVQVGPSGTRRARTDLVCDRRTRPARVGLGSLSSSVALHLPCFQCDPAEVLGAHTDRSKPGSASVSGDVCQTNRLIGDCSLTAAQAA